ncbi:hypothetical protein [Staphylococcus hominis]
MEHLEIKNENFIDSIVENLKVPRDILPSQPQIDYTLDSLPRELEKIPPRLRDEFIVKAVIASAVGLFDGAIVYVWNSVINELRTKVNNFGIDMISQIYKEKKEGFLKNISDNELLILCNQLGIISSQGFYYLDQCRDIRNNASIAHPSNIELDENELINFISRCCKYGLSDENIQQGIGLKEFTQTLSQDNLSNEVLDTLSNNVLNTFQSQQEFIICNILYSNFVNDKKPQSIRINSLSLAKKIKEIINEKVITNLISRHNEKKLKGKNTKLSEKFLKEIGLLNYLGEQDKINIYKKAIKQLENSHLGFDNFYNEPPFSENLRNLSLEMTPIPEVIIPEYVKVNLICYLGNDYGVSTEAHDNYKMMLENLSPKGIQYLLKYIEQEEQYIEKELKHKWKKNFILSLIKHYDNPNVIDNNQRQILKEINRKYNLEYE